MHGANGDVHGRNGVAWRAEGERAVAARALPYLFWNGTTDGLFALDVVDKGCFVFQGANSAFARLASLGDLDLAGLRVACLPRAIAGALNARCKHCVATGMPLHYDEIVSIGKQPAWLRTELTPLKDPQTGVVRTILGRMQNNGPNRETGHGMDPSQRLLRQIVDTSPDAIYVFDLVAGRNVFLSNRVRRVLGYPHELLEGLDTERLLQLVHPEDVPSIRQHLLKVGALADGAVATAEFRCLTGHAGYRWFRSKETVFSRMPDGSVEKIVGILSDIDRLKKMRLGFLQTNAQLKEILASISDCYLTIDRECRVTAANAAAAKWLRRSLSETTGQKLRKLTGNTEGQKLVAKALREKCSVHGEVRSRLHPGRWVDLRAYPTREGASIFFSDVTQRKRAEQAAAWSDALRDASLDSLSVQIVILDTRGTIVACNKAWRAFATSLKARSPRRGTNVVALYEHANRVSGEAHQVAQDLKSLLAGRVKTVRRAYSVDRPQGERWYQLDAARFAHSGETFAVLAIEDATEARHAKRTLGELSDRLLSLQDDERQRIVNELHNSTAQHLAAIGLNAMILKDRSDASAETESLWQDVDRSLAMATRELRAFMYVLHPLQLDSDGFSATLRRFVDGFAARTGLKATLKLGSDIDKLSVAHQRSLLRTVQEALVNAHVHTMATRVSISHDRAAGRHHLIIKDNGREHKSSAGNGRWDQRRVLGVGMPAIRERLKRLGGNLEIKVARGGTTINVSVPLSRRQAAGEVVTDQEISRHRPTDPTQ